MKKLTLIFLALLLAACATPQANGNVQPTSIELASPTALQLQATQTPIPEPTSTPTTGMATFVAPAAPAAGEKLTFESIDMSDQNVGWGIDKLGRIFHTTDGGETWTFASPPDGVYTHGGFFALDGNSAWAARDVPVRCWDYLAIYQCNQLYYAALKSGTVWKTSDGGLSWQPSQPFSLNIEKAPYSFDGALPFSPAGLQFIDHQTGWLLVAVGQTPAGEQSLMYRTGDGGLTWDLLQSFGFEPAIYACRKQGFTFSDMHSGWLMADCPQAESGTPATVFSTIDDGANWSPETQTQSSPALAKLQAAQNGEFSLDASHGWRLYVDAATRERWLQQTSDNGQTWESTKRVDWTTARFEFVDSQTGWAIVTDGAGQPTLVKTTDGGQTWGLLAGRVAGGEVLADSNPPGATPKNSQIPLDIAEFWMINNSIGWAVTTDDQIVRTIDGAQTWQEVTPPADYNAVKNQCPKDDTIIIHAGLKPKGFFALDDKKAWAAQTGCSATSAKVWRTNDGGQIWRVTLLDLPESMGGCGGPFFSPMVDFINANEGWLDTGLYGCNHSIEERLFETQDGGISWQLAADSAIRCDQYCNDMLFANSSTGFIIEDNQYRGSWGDSINFIATTDGGKNLENISLPKDFSDSPPNPVLAERIRKMKTGKYDTACGAAQLKRFPDTRIGLFESCFFENGYFVINYLAFFKGTSATERILYDGMSAGADIGDFHGSFGWTTNQSDFFLNDQLGWRLYIGTDKDANGPTYLQRTRDGGDIWETIAAVPWQNARFQFVDPQNGWALVSLPWGNALVKTSDGGLTWEEIKPVIENP